MKLPRQKYPTVAPINTHHLNGVYEDIGNVINGGIEFGSPSNSQNISGVWYKGKTPSSANTEFKVTHNLGRIPTGALTFSIDQAGIVYRSTTAWTSTVAYLKCSVSGANIALFLT